MNGYRRQELLTEVKRLLDFDCPSGCSVGWDVYRVGSQSVPHVHFHVVGRFADEPIASQGHMPYLEATAEPTINITEGCRTMTNLALIVICCPDSLLS